MYVTAIVGYPHCRHLGFVYSILSSQFIFIVVVVVVVCKLVHVIVLLGLALVLLGVTLNNL